MACVVFVYIKDFLSCFIMFRSGDLNKIGYHFLFFCNCSVFFLFFGEKGIHRKFLVLHYIWHVLFLFYDVCAFGNFEIRELVELYKKSFGIN